MRRLFDVILEANKKGLDYDPNQIQGKDAEKNKTKGAIGIDEPTDDTAQKVHIDKKSLNKNMKRLLMKFKSEEDFFIIGRAGWGKTSIIQDLAEKQGREVITFYLDKCEATDLGGTPIPTKDEKGRAQIQTALPPFAERIAKNPKKKFLLFFDEMNQAAPDVMNALMPIVLEHEIAGQKFDNFFCGAAGNFESENGAVNELSGPLKSRFKPLIIWETNTDDTWAQAFKYLHEKWDEVLSKKLVDAFEECANLFDNPREIERNVFKFMKNLKEDGDYEDFEPEDYLDRLEGIASEDLTRSQQAKLSELAESMYECMNTKEEEKQEKEEKKKRGKRGIDMVPKEIKDAIRKGMEFGYLKGEDGKKYGISRENIFDSIDYESTEEGTNLNREMIERVVQKFEDDGVRFKFEKDKEWKDKGYLDPNDA